MIHAGEQWNLWDYVHRHTSKEFEQRNKLGPFPLTSDSLVISRHMDCTNYDACLSYAAKHRWDSFSCKGCRKTQHGMFVFDKNRSNSK